MTDALDELREMVERMIGVDDDPHAAGALLAVLMCIDAITGRRAPAGTGTVSGYQARQAVFDDPAKDAETCVSDAPSEHPEDDHAV